MSVHCVDNSGTQGGPIWSNVEDDDEDEESTYSVNVWRNVFWPLAEILDIRALASVWWLSVEG